MSGRSSNASAAKKIQRGIELIAVNLKGASFDGLDVKAKAIRDDVRERTKRRTGMLADSYSINWTGSRKKYGDTGPKAKKKHGVQQPHVRGNMIRLVVGSAAPHAHLYEYGTDRGARPHLVLTNAMRRHGMNLSRHMEKYLEKAFDRAAKKAAAL